MTAGPWLGELFRRTVRPISKVVRQDIVYVSTPEAETVFDADRMPCWVDHGYGAYGTPSVEGCGVKAAIAWEETVIDLDEDERVVEASAFHRTRQYLRHRFPGLVGQRAVDQKACQIAMTPDTHFIIDFHPEHENVLIAGGCSGHLFKHGPMFGDFVAGGRPSRVGDRGPVSPRPPAGPLARGIALRTLTGAAAGRSMRPAEPSAGSFRLERSTGPSTTSDPGPRRSILRMDRRLAADRAPARRPSDSDRRRHAHASRG